MRQPYAPQGDALKPCARSRAWGFRSGYPRRSAVPPSERCVKLGGNKIDINPSPWRAPLPRPWRVPPLPLAGRRRSSVSTDDRTRSSPGLGRSVDIQPHSRLFRSWTPLLGRTSPGLACRMRPTGRSPSEGAPTRSALLDGKGQAERRRGLVSRPLPIPAFAWLAGSCCARARRRRRGLPLPQSWVSLRRRTSPSLLRRFPRRWHAQRRPCFPRAIRKRR
jgi:hypothetical protein